MNHTATLTINSAATWTLRKGMAAILIAGFCGSALTTARAASYTFDANTSSAGVQDGSGTWNTTLANFWNGTSDVQWPNQNTDVAVFGVGGGSGAMTITTGNVTTNGITFAPVSTVGTTYYLTSGGTITLAGATPTITVNATNGGTIRSALVSTSGFVKAGTGGLTIGSTTGQDADLSGLSGTVRIDTGAIFLSTNGAAATWHLNSNTAVLALSSNTSVSIGALSGVSGATFRTAGSTLPTASIGALNTDSNYAGKITGTISITKVGTGTQTFSGSGNTYTGTTTVSQGTLLLSGAAVISSSPTVEVQSGATLDVSGVNGGVYTFTATQLLKGAGTVKGNSIVNGSLQPGSSPGILSFANNLTLANTTQTTIELASGARGTNFDGINVGGALVYDGTLTLSIGAALLNGTYNIFDFASNSGTLDLVAFSGGVYAGTFSYDGTSLWTSTDTNGSGQTFTFDQASGDLTVVPEPNTWALALFGAMFAVFVVRRSSAHKA